MEIIGFHGTSSIWRESIDRIGLDPKKSNYRADHWLGQGVYFFKEFGIARWWAKSIVHKQKEENYSLIYRAVIEASEEEILNLDDNEQLDKFVTEILEYLDEMEATCSDKMPIFTNKKLRAVFFDYYKQVNNISVMIRTFLKDKVKYGVIRRNNDLKNQQKLLRTLGIYYNETQICVSNKDVIKSVELVYNDEEEVI